MLVAVLVFVCGLSWCRLACAVQAPGVPDPTPPDLQWPMCCAIAVSLCVCVCFLHVQVRDMVGNNPIVLVGTKMDLLPQGASPKEVAAWLTEAAGRKRLMVRGDNRGRIDWAWRCKLGAGMGGAVCCCVCLHE